MWLGLLASVCAAGFLVWARDDENDDDVDDDEEDDDDNDNDDAADREQQKQRKITRRRRQRRRRRRRRTLLTTRTSRRRWTAAVRTTLVVTAILRLILSVGPEPTLWLLGAITVYSCLPPFSIFDIFMIFYIYTIYILHSDPPTQLFSTSHLPSFYIFLTTGSNEKCTYHQHHGQSGYIY